MYILISFLITAFAQPAWIGAFGILAASIGYAMFWHGMLQFTRRRDRFWIASLWFAALQGVQFSWIATPDYMGPLIIIFYFLLISGMGMQFGLISSFISRELSWHKSLAIAGGWVLCEGARLYFLCGLSWNPVGIALTTSSYSIQFASLFGIFGLSFWVIFVNLVLLKRKVAIWSVLALLPYLYGFVNQLVVEKFVPINNTFDVALVNTHLSPPKRDWGMPHVDQWRQIIASLPEKADLIVLPEAALPHSAHSPILAVDALRDLIPAEPGRNVSNAFIAQALANQYNAHVIIGLDDRDRTGKYNAAFHFSPHSVEFERYEKQILAPIGEYIPLAGMEWFSRFVGEQFGIYSSFDPGVEAKIFHAQVPIGISICLEETFSNLMRKTKVLGAQMLVSISNDAFFPHSKLAKQHFDHGKVRAAENGVPLLRSCNSGISGAVDCFGKDIKISSNSTVSLTLPVRFYKTLYSFWGDSAIFSLSVFFVLSLLLMHSREEKVAVKG